MLRDGFLHFSRAGAASGRRGSRPGEEVLVIRQPGTPVSFGKNRVAHLTAAAVLPTRWAE